MAYDFPSSPTTGQIITGPNGIQYQWDGVKWLAAGSLGATPFAPAGAINDVGRNLLHNPLFNVAQRGVGPFTANGYTLDRWLFFANLDTGVSITQAALDDARRVAIGDEAARVCHGIAFTGNAGAAAYTEFLHRIENVTRLAGKTVTLSMWAWASSAMQLGISGANVYGTGGSPSTQDAFTGITPLALTTSPQRFSRTFTLPSSSGKTLGTNGDSFTQLQFWCSTGSTNAPTSGIGVQSGTIYIWGIQLEIGTVATPLEKPDPQQDLAKCQRFYQSLPFYFNNYGNVAGAGIYWNTMWPVVMRAAPSMTFVGTSYANASGLVSANIWANGGGVVAVVTAAGNGSVTSTMLLSADL